MCVCVYVPMCLGLEVHEGEGEFVCVKVWNNTHTCVHS